MNGQSMYFLTDLKKLNIAEDIEADYVAYATGVAVGKKLTLPETLVEGQEDSFNQNLIQKARDLISKVNELSIFDTQQALSVAKATYYVRYSALFNEPMDASMQECIWCDVFNISKAFAHIDYSFIQDKKAFLDLVGLVSSVLIEKDI